MKIFITGGTGYIGKRLIKLLLAISHHEIIILTRGTKKSNQKRLKYIQGNLNNIALIKSIFKNFKPQVLIHLAWEGLPDYSIHKCKQNLDYSFNVFYSAANSDCKTIISIGSCWEYESRKGKISENDKLNSNTIFSAVKNAIRFIGEAIANEYKIEFYWLRLFFVYGPGQRNSSLIPTIINSVKNGKIPIVNTPKNGNDFIFVDDVAKAIYSILMTKPDHYIYNIGTGYATIVEHVVEMIYSLLKIKLDKKIYENIESQNKQIYYADISKIQKDTNWNPDFDLNKGLQAIIFNK